MLRICIDVIRILIDKRRFLVRIPIDALPGKHHEAAGVNDAFDTFIEKWPDGEEIDAHRIRFRIELVRMLSILGRRMIKENRQLYPMVDAERVLPAG